MSKAVPERTGLDSPDERDAHRRALHAPGEFFRVEAACGIVLIAAILGYVWLCAVLLPRVQVVD
jgi:hypothetical protein